jgi:glycosyltransferase involved in cell wall biosynthesis
VKFIPHQKNKGLCATLNEALSHARGEFVQIIACDDIMTKNKIEVQVDLLTQAGKNTALSCSNFISIDPQGSPLKQEFPDDFEFPYDGHLFKYILNGYDGYSRLVHSPTVLVRKSVIEKMGGYDPGVIQEDLDMWLRITRLYEVVYSPLVLVKYRVLGTSLSNSKVLRPRLLRDRFLVGAKLLREKLTDKESDEILKHNRRVLKSAVSLEESTNKMQRIFKIISIDQMSDSELRSVRTREGLDRTMKNLKPDFGPANIFKIIEMVGRVLKHRLGI